MRLDDFLATFDVGGGGNAKKPGDGDGKPAQDADKIWTRQELDGMVTKGQLTEVQVENILEGQRVKVTTAAVRESLSADLQDRDRGKTYQGEIDRYFSILPDLGNKESEAYKRVAASFAELVDLGQDKVGIPGKRTELLALRQTFGPILSLERNKGKGARSAFELGSGEGDGDVTADTDRHGNAMPKGLSDSQKTHYRYLVDRGLYDWTQVADELKRSKELRGPDGAGRSKMKREPARRGDAQRARPGAGTA